MKIHIYKDRPIDLSTKISSTELLLTGPLPTAIVMLIKSYFQVKKEQIRIGTDFIDTVAVPSAVDRSLHLTFSALSFDRLTFHTNHQEWLNMQATSGLC